MRDMIILLVAFAVLVAILVLLARTVLEDGYGVRPPPRSHRAEEEVDSQGFPLHRVGQRS